MLADPRMADGFKLVVFADNGIRLAVSGRGSRGWGWRGTSFNKTVESKQKNLKVYQSLFDKKKGADLDGLVLGIAGDKVRVFLLLLISVKG